MASALHGEGEREDGPLRQRHLVDYSEHNNQPNVIQAVPRQLQLAADGGEDTVGANEESCFQRGAIRQRHRHSIFTFSFTCICTFPLFLLGRMLVGRPALEALEL